MPIEYPVVDASQWAVLDDEPMGSKAKEWLLPPSTDRPWLFKEVRRERHGLERVLGEDWTEKVAAELAALLGVATATVQLAQREGRRGILSRHLLPDRKRLTLVHGNELLQARDPQYDRDRRGEAPGYTLEAALEVLGSYGAPPGSPAEVARAADAFAGYLLLDALIANADRHHENWAVVVAPGNEQGWLAPSFDQASSLGYQANGVEKDRLVRNGDVLSWARRGRSKHFQGRPSLVDLATAALAEVDERVADGWKSRLEALSQEDWTPILNAVPARLMSQGDRIFAAEVLRVNRERLLGAC
jgi:hypothetical protein